MAGSTPAFPTAEVEAAGSRPAAVSLARADAPLPRRRVSLGLEAWRRFRRHRLALVSIGVLAAIILAVTLGPLLWHVPINDIDFTARLQGPSWQHPMGTDDLGQDLLARV